MKKLTIGSCFSGIGGLELGLEWTGKFETKWQIEQDEYATRILEKRWPNVTRYRDIRDVVRPEPVDVICGGFPCQDVSLAGKRSGLEGKRSTLWGEMFRIICEIKPRWVLAENVPGLLSSDDGRFFGNILWNLASSGYDAQWGMLSAASVGAPHLRQRIFIIADTKCVGREKGTGWEGIQSKKQDTIRQDIINVCKVFSNTTEQGLERTITTGSKCPERRPMQLPERDWWSVEPNVGRMAHGVPHRVDRLKCLGNAVVPQVAHKLGLMLLNHIENSCQI